MIDHEELLDYVFYVGNFLTVEVQHASFGRVKVKQRKLRENLNEVEKVLGADALEIINTEDYSKIQQLDDISACVYRILFSTKRVAEARNISEIADTIQYDDSRFDSLWDAIEAAGIEYEDKDYD